MTAQHFSSWLKNASVAAINAAHRLIIVLEGSDEWLEGLLNVLPQHTVGHRPDDILIYSDDEKTLGNVNKHTFKNKLGVESQFVVFHVDRLNIDALAALSGTIVPGGALIFVTSSTEHSLAISSFNKRLFDKIYGHKNITYFTESSLIQNAVTDTKVIERSLTDKSFEFGCKTKDQVKAVEQVIKVVNGHRNRPLVFTADRGRGKSSALAIACAHILEEAKTPINIVITSAHRKSLNIFFAQLQVSFHSKFLFKNKNLIEHVNGSVQFVAMDELLRSKPDLGLLIIDEAASVPLYQLNELIQHYHRMVFSSTIHGYEGAGRSFSIKFWQQLQAVFPEATSLHIKEPIRWGNNDPLEGFIFDLCLLNATLPTLDFDVTNIQSHAVVYSQVTAQELLENEKLLSEIFAILVTAHYQTSPSDVRLLLDNDKMDIVVMLLNSHIVGVALLMKEGDASLSEIDLIKSNVRRLKNQFIPQSLLTHCGEETSFNYAYVRVMRIAILPALQSKGLGCKFLTHLEKTAKDNGIDFIGTSFGASEQLLNFWLNQHYKIARLGFTKDKASGENSALMLKSLNDKATNFVKSIEESFYTSFDFLLAEQFKYLPAKLVWQIMHFCPANILPMLTKKDDKAIVDFYTGQRQYNHCALSLHKWLQYQMLHEYNPAMQIMINKVFQRTDVEVLCAQYKMLGKKAFNQYVLAFVSDYAKRMIRH